MKYVLPLLALLAACGSDINKKGGKTAQNSEPNAATGSNNLASNNLASNNATATNGTTVTIPNNGTTDRDWSDCYVDLDGDGFGGESMAIDSLCALAGLVDVGGDCADDDPARYPNATEACDGVDRDCDGSWSPQVPETCPTIQAAIDRAVDVGFEGDIVVRSGTYLENIVFSGARVRLLGSGPATTIIDGSSLAESVVRFEDFEGADSILEGFTIRGGSGHSTGDSLEGGGIWIDEADPTLRNLVVEDNAAEGDSGYGGGISMSRSRATIERVDVINNRATYYGGGLHVSQSDATFVQLRVAANRSLYGGGAALYFSNAEFSASIFAGNVATYGGGALLQGDSPRFDHVHFVGNDADDGGGVLLTSSTTAVLRNTNLSGNRADTGGAISNEQGSPNLAWINLFDNGASPIANFASTIEGRIEAAPGFVSTSGAPAAWDLHLIPTSSLRDAGDPAATDVDGSRADIGAYGGASGDW